MSISEQHWRFRIDIIGFDQLDPLSGTHPPARSPTHPPTHTHPPMHPFSPRPAYPRTRRPSYRPTQAPARRTHSSTLRYAARICSRTLILGERNGGNGHSLLLLACRTPQHDGVSHSREASLAMDQAIRGPTDRSTCH